MINLTIDGQPVSVPEGTTILDAAKTLHVDVPTLCYLNLEKIKYLNQVASCRICVVEVEGRRNLAPACATPVMEGMKDMKSSAAGLLGFALSLKVVVKLVDIVGSMDPDTVENGMKRLAIIGGALVALMVILGRFGKDAKSMIAGTAGMLIISLALLEMAGVIAIFGNMNPAALTQGMGAIGNSITALVFTMMALGVVDTKKALLGVAGILLLVGALALLTPIILTFAAVPFDKLKDGILGIALVMGVLGIFGSVALMLSPWALTILGFVFFVAGISMLKYRRDTDEVQAQSQN